MFEIKVIVDLPGIPDAINNLANALSGNGKCISTTPAFVEDTAQAPATVADVVPLAQVPQEATRAMVDPVSPPAPAPASVPAPAPAPVTRNYNFDDISNAGADLCGQGEEMTQRLVNLLTTKYGVESIVDLPESRYNEIAADLQAMGAKMG